MDIVERLRGHAKGNAGGVRELLVLSADEIERLREIIWHIAAHCKSYDPPDAQAILSYIDKATGGE